MSIKLYEWFFRNSSHVRSFSPQTGLMLSDIESEIRQTAKKETDAEVKRELEEYADALQTVCTTSAMQQKAVINKLKCLLSKGE